jgi:lipid-A-disaccharide synthase
MSAATPGARPASPLPAHPDPLIFLVAGEESGDRLGAALMEAIRARCDGGVRFAGVGGQAMAAQGLASLFPIHELAIVGFGIAGKLPSILRRIRQTADAVIAARPDVLVIIDSPDFTHRVARRVRAAAPDIPIVDYVCPSVWAWRPWRARAMRRYIDHVLALLPFEPETLLKLGGPSCTFVGHPLSESVETLRPDDAEAQRRRTDPPLALLLPGSRHNELKRLLSTFARAVDLLDERAGPLDLALPTVPHLAGEIQRAVATWRLQPRILVDASDKYAAFRTARVALTKSGTVTLELALSGVPMVAAYKVSALEAIIIRRLIHAPSAILANLVLGENVVPEFMQEDCTPDALADALRPLLSDTPERRRQVDAFARLDAIMQIGSARPSDRAAAAVMAMMRR